MLLQHQVLTDRLRLIDLTLLFLIATTEYAWFGVKTVCEVCTLGQVLQIFSSMVVHVLYANLDVDDVDHANFEELQNFNGHRFGSLAAFMAFRLITYRFFKFKQDEPHQLFSAEVHEAVPGSPLELARSKRERAAVSQADSALVSRDSEDPAP